MLGNFPELSAREVKELLRQNLPKFDTQDDAIIEALLRDKDKILEKSFIESVDNYLKNADLENHGNFLKSEEGQKIIVETFISVIHNLIDYFYNALLTKQFSG